MPLSPRFCRRYVGVWNSAAKLVVTSALGKSFAQHVAKGTGTRNLEFIIDFIGDVAVQWGRDGDDDGNLTWQAAQLGTPSAETGVVLQAVVMIDE